MSKIKISKQDVINLSTACNNILSMDKIMISPKFGYCLRRNTDKLKLEVEPIRAQVQEILKDFNNEMAEINKRYADDKGYTNAKEYESDSDYISERTNLLNNKYVTQNKEAEEFLFSDTEIEIHTINVSSVPDLPGIYINWLYPILTDED